MDRHELKARIKQIGLTQKKLAQLCGVTQQAVCLWTKGASPVPGYAETIIQQRIKIKNLMEAATMVNEDLWNESLFDGANEGEIDMLNDALENGLLADFEPYPNDVSEMTESECVQHARLTRDAFLSSTKQS